jgi:hypothetical protein
MTESLYPGAASWELDTLFQEPRLLHFYEKLGYRREGAETPINDRLSLAFYKKYAVSNADSCPAEKQTGRGNNE